MTPRERFVKTLSGERPDRLPVVEWASWWDKTVARWRGEGMPELSGTGMMEYFGLDVLHQFWLPHRKPGLPSPAYNGAPIIETEDDYERIKPYLFPEDAVTRYRDVFAKLKPAHDAGQFTVWYTLEGYFWFPRTLFGIEGHLYSFYDQPQLYHRICRDLMEWELICAEQISEMIQPDFMTFAEDMSYNNGPMLSEPMFEEFLAPYYKKLIPTIKKAGTRVIVDTDGDVTLMIPWLKEAGVEGVLPLERQAGVDLNQIRADWPEFILIGGFDKMVMKRGEEAMRAEFERLLPCMRSGRCVPGVDHQTPPDVSIDNYRIYVRLLKEYAEKACG